MKRGKQITLIKLWFLASMAIAFFLVGVFLYSQRPPAIVFAVWLLFWAILFAFPIIILYRGKIGSLIHQTSVPTVPTAPQWGWPPQTTELYQLGFEHVGRIISSGHNLRVDLKRAHMGQGIYALITNNELSYIGKTHKGLESRLNYYCIPNSTDFTDRKVHDGLMQRGGAAVLFLSKHQIEGHTSATLFNGIPVDTKLDYHILEPILISRFKPALNTHGVTS